MKRTTRSALSILIILVVIFSIFAMPAQAMSLEPSQTELTEEMTVTPRSVISTKYYYRSTCKSIYTKMSAYSSWDTLLAQALADVVGVGYFTSLNFNQAKSAFYYGGYGSGYTGCKMYIFDNASPYVTAY